MRGIVDVVAMVVVANGMDDEYDEYNDAAMTSRRRTMGRTRDAAVGWRGGRNGSGDEGTGGTLTSRRRTRTTTTQKWTPEATRRCCGST